MIAAHRRAHRRIALVLWPLVAALFATALASRRPDPRPSEWPSWLAASSATPSAAASVDRPRRGTDRPLEMRREDAFGLWPARLAWSDDGLVEITPLRPLDRPELLLYWVDGEIEGGALPADARLIGRIASTSPQRFMLPEAAIAEPSIAGGARGLLVIYSLGHQEIVATARLAPAGAGAMAGATTEATAGAASKTGAER